MASQSLPSTMRAWMRPLRGPLATSLKLVTAPTPTIRHDSAEILVRVSYVALQWTSGVAVETLPQLPGMPVRTPEMEYSGVVVQAGSKAPPELREPGARVQGFRTISSLLIGHGVLCEYVISTPDQLSRLPDAVGLVMAAGMVCCGSTAFKMVRAADGLNSGDRVLVNGASSSIGSMLVQVCKAKGVFIVGVASGRNEELVRGLKVDEFIDYTAHESLPASLKSKYSNEPFDWVFDCAGIQALYVASPDYLKPSGAVINVGALESGVFAAFRNWFVNTWLPVWLGGVPRRYIMFSTPPDKDSAIRMAGLMQDGTVRVLVDSVWEMEDALKAYERVATNRARGKVIIKVNDERSSVRAT